MSSFRSGQWYVVYSNPRKEKVAEFHLQLGGLEVFFPQLLFLEPHPRRRRIVPLFPRYLFARMDTPGEYYQALRTLGVKNLVGCNGTPTPLDEEIVAALRRRATPEGILTARADLAAGKEIQIVKGPLEGFAGIIQNPPDARGRVRVLMELLGRQVRVEMSVHSVKSGGWVVVGEGKKEQSVSLPEN